MKGEKSSKISRGESMKADAKNPLEALLIVDLQVDFCPGGSLEVREGDRIVPLVNGLIPRFAKVVATQDWHPGDHVSFASNHPGKEPFQTVALGGVEQTLWPDHCLQGSRGAELHPLLDTAGIDLILRKGANPNLDSYSAFFENDRRTPTGLEFYLKGLGIGKLYLTGLATDVCVFHSAMDALRLGFTVFLVEDAARGIDTPPGSLAARLREMEAAGARVVRTGQVIRGKGGQK